MGAGAYILLADGGAGPVAASSAPLISRLLLEQVKQSIGYRTDVLTAWSGLEQRIALAPYPRESLSFQVTLGDADLRTLRGLLFTAPETPVLLPMRVEETAAIADITGASITIDSRLIDWPDTNVGWQVLVENFAGQSYVATVSAVSGYGTSSTVLTVDVAPPLGQTYAAGAHVIPLRSVYLQDGPLSARYPVNAGVLHLAGVVQPVRVTIGTGATVTTFDGLPIFDRRINADQAVQESNMARLAWVDSGAGGPVSTRTALAVADLLRANVFVIKSIAERQWLRKFWQTVLGRQGLFLCPTWKTDLDLFAQPIGGSTTIVIDNDPNYVTTWFPSLAHRRLQLNFTDGTVGYVKITAAVDNGNGTQSLTTSAPLVVPTTVASISLLEQVRFDTDELVITWQSTNGRCPVPMMVVQQ